MSVYPLSIVLEILYHRFFAYKTHENVNGTTYDKQCLLLYITRPFWGKTINRSHQNQWQARELARIIGEFGYNVDVIHYRDTEAKLKKKYDLIIDLHPGLNDVYKNFMSDSCIKVAYMTGSNQSFANKAEAERIEALFRRKGVRLMQRRYYRPFKKSEFESFDAMFFIGNSYNLKTYSEFNLKSVSFIKNTGYDFLKNTDFSKKSSQNFLFLGGPGQIHKGLDLLLDIFGVNKHLNLYVCSRFKRERDFYKLYKKALLHTDNIFPIGFVNIAGRKFKDICKLCSYVVLPSCSEGIATNVLTGMSAGLVPIASRECGFEDDEVHHFEDNSIDCIEETLNFFAQKTPEWVRAESMKAMEIVQTRYSEKNFSDSVRAAMRGLLSHHSKQQR